jgi:geranylgeranyl pyrophosphate synthase
MINTIISLYDPVHESLQEVEDLVCAQVNGNRSSLELALSQLISAGGKRIRPRIAILVGNMLGADHTSLTFLAASIEMLHTASLIHDDLIDGAILRRGMETLNIRWSPAASVLVGDLAFTKASQLILSTASLPVVGIFNETMARMVDGEIIQFARTRGATSREEYYRWIEAKTASMFEMAAGAAARLCLDDIDVIAITRAFGFGIGMAFQVMDDILDFTGEQAILGKPIGSDLRQRTMTLPALVYLENHPEDPDLLALINRSPIREDHIERLISSIRHSKAIDQCLSEADGFLRHGLEALRELPETPERRSLMELANSIVHRNM